MEYYYVMQLQLTITIAIVYLLTFIKLVNP
jgi:hypothetical protein